jgi:DNA-binding NarL/FixJ family response regulator
MKKINLFLVDDHQLIVDGLTSMLGQTDEIVVTGSASNGREAIRLLQVVHPDVVLMDIDMPVMNGIDALREIKKLEPSVKVVILSMHEEAGMIKNLMALGADGYLLKSCSQDELVGAIQSVFGGKPYFSKGVTLALLNAPAGSFPVSGQPTEVLTERETEVLKLITEGFSNKEIGNKLFISHRTVDTHRTNLMKKLNTSNIAGLISYAIRKGLV